MSPRNSTWETLSTEYSTVKWVFLSHTDSVTFTLGQAFAPSVLLEFFTNSPQYKNAKFANFLLAVISERNWTNEACKIEM